MSFWSVRMSLIHTVLLTYAWTSLLAHVSDTPVQQRAEPRLAIPVAARIRRILTHLIQRKGSIGCYNAIDLTQIAKDQVNQKSLLRQADNDLAVGGVPYMPVGTLRTGLRTATVERVQATYKW